MSPKVVRRFIFPFIFPFLSLSSTGKERFGASRTQARAIKQGILRSFASQRMRSLGGASTTARARARERARARAAARSSISSPPPSSSLSSRPPRPRPRLPLLASPRSCPPWNSREIAASSSSSSSSALEGDLQAFSTFVAVAAAVKGGGERASLSSSDPDPDPDLAWRLLSRFSAADFAGRAPALLADPQRREALRSALRVVSRNARVANGWFPSGSKSNSTPAANSPLPPPPLVVAVLASSHELACRALRDYLDLFELPYCPPAPRIAAGSGGVFVKVSASSLVALAAHGDRDGERRELTKSSPSSSSSSDPASSPSSSSPLQLPRASPYVGKDRGVLLTLGDTQFGHLPLGLLDENRERPAPALE